MLVERVDVMRFVEVHEIGEKPESNVHTCSRYALVNDASDHLLIGFRIMTTNLASGSSCLSRCAFVRDELLNAGLQWRLRTVKIVDGLPSTIERQ